jgi:hypothetical protein
MLTTVESIDNASLARLADGALAELSACIAPRQMTPPEEGLIRSVFWTRAAAAQGDWIQVRFAPGGPEISIDQAWKRGFIALSTRMLGVRKLEIVRWD